MLPLDSFTLLFLLPSVIVLIQRGRCDSLGTLSFDVLVPSCVIACLRTCFSLVEVVGLILTGFPLLLHEGINQSVNNPDNFCGT